MIYLDASAIVKLVVAEPETPVLRRYLRGHRDRITSDLAVTEVLRAAARHDESVVVRADEVLSRLDRMRVTPRIAERAGRLDPSELRTLDALHVATALEISGDLDALVAYDQRLLEAASVHRLPTVSPS